MGTVVSVMASEPWCVGGSIEHSCVWVVVGVVLGWVCLLWFGFLWSDRSTSTGSRTTGRYTILEEYPNIKYKPLLTKFHSHRTRTGSVTPLFVPKKKRPQNGH